MNNETQVMSSLRAKLLKQLADPATDPRDVVELVYKHIDAHSNEASKLWVEVSTDAEIEATFKRQEQAAIKEQKGMMPRH